MAPKRSNAREATPSAPATTQSSTTAAGTAPPARTSRSSGNQTWDKVVMNIANYYTESTPQRTKLIDAFMAFLVVVGGIQFLYCILAGNYVSILPLTRLDLALDKTGES